MPVFTACQFYTASVSSFEGSDFVCLSEVLLNVSPASGIVTVFSLIQTKDKVWHSKGPEVTLESQHHSRRIHSVFSEEIPAVKKC